MPRPNPFGSTTILLMLTFALGLAVGVAIPRAESAPVRVVTVWR
jgi:hypothetical protein